MSAIKQALARLEGVVGGLEGSVLSFERAHAGEQRDMFAAPPPVNKGALPDLDPAILAERLDRAIEQVEDMLEEA